MKQFLFIITILTTAINFAANEPIGKISGQVIDSELKEPIPYATIIVNDKEGNFISGNTTSEDGTFTIDKLEAGDYLFKVQFIGYKSYDREISISSDRSTVDIGVISLEPDIAMLDDVTVVAERSTIEQRIDRKVINVGKDLTTTSATASDIMNNVPSVSVDQDGNIAMRGNSNVRILVDGKPTNMDPAQLLKQIPSTSIKSIELITNPSAKYNPEGMSGIINIVLHKNANDGFNGNVNLGVTQGENTRYNGSLDMNYRKGKVNFFGSFGANGGENFNEGRIYNPEEDFLQAFNLLQSRQSYLGKVGMDLYLNDRNTISFYTNQNFFEGGPEGIFRLIYNDTPEQNLSQVLDFYVENLNSAYNFVYDHKFDDKDHKIQLEVNYNDFDEEENSRFSFTGNTGGLAPYTDFVKEKREDLTTNLDYTNPIGEKGKLEIGAEARLLDTDNSYITNSEFLNDAEYQYTRDIYSFYTTFGQNFEKWSYQLGARLENFTVDAVYNNEKIFEDEYFNIYPSGFLNFTPNQKNTYQLSYSRRVDRPGFQQVSPIREVSTPRLTILGNPSLEPQFTNSVEFNYTRNLTEKGSITAGVFFRNISDEINQVIIENPEEEGSLILMFDNFEDNNSYGLEVSANYKFTKWWSTNSTFEVYSQQLKGVVGTEFLEMDNTAFTFRSNHSFKATDKLTFQLFGLYRGENQTLQMDMLPFYFVNAGARYSILDNKGTLSLNFNDVLNSQRFRFINGRLYLRKEGSRENPEQYS
ncbi:TonB-dependent receptor [Antarcticibacterium sp. 1MA-6-2]|uniref:outer membrane beta-barrel protein n=1 Tax=Antarcticibacterium sp. 1MA-6-2 TaxID=2908210 RepID=UPI001F17CFA1|nr:outer membrane beta-barrel protein [Antarcticibacterium sp. 1MA-6-2]UJH92396.1 TonB-dependent receptor [Antarcticibacterium sp. 1MA-6-2]